MKGRGILKSSVKRLDTRCLYMGIRRLTNDYRAIPYAMKKPSGEPIGYRNRAAGAAEYLADICSKGTDFEVKRKDAIAEAVCAI